MKLKRLTLIAIVVFMVAFLFVVPVFAQGADPPNPVAQFQSVFIAVLAAVGIGSAIALLLQIGKILLPSVFPDGAVQNWRLLFALLISLLLFFGPRLGLAITVEQFDSISKSIAELGDVLLPVFVWIVDVASKGFYSGVLRGRILIGKSYSLTRASKEERIKRAEEIKAAKATKAAKIAQLKKG